MKKIPSFEEFCGQSETDENNVLQNRCPSCGANLKSNICDYCGNFYGKRTNHVKSKKTIKPQVTRESIECDWDRLGFMSRYANTHSLNE